MLGKKGEDTFEKEEMGKEKIDIELDDVLKGASNLIDIVTNLKHEGRFGTLNLEDIKDLQEKTRGLVGMSVKVDTCGVSSSKEVLVRVPGEEEPAADKGVREPLTDVFEEGDCIEVIAELPGLEEKDIKYEIKAQKTSHGDVMPVLTIYSINDKRKYKKELPLSFSVSVEDVQSVYKNGILKLRLRKHP